MSNTHQHQEREEDQETPKQLLLSDCTLLASDELHQLINLANNRQSRVSG
jgi:hypothetical protein